MGILDWGILAVLAALFGLAVRYCVRHKGCTGCSGCSGDCKRCRRGKQ